MNPRRNFMVHCVVVMYRTLTGTEPRRQRAPFGKRAQRGRGGAGRPQERRACGHAAHATARRRRAARACSLSWPPPPPRRQSKCRLGRTGSSGHSPSCHRARCRGRQGGGAHTCSRWAFGPTDLHCHSGMALGAVASMQPARQVRAQTASHAIVRARPRSPASSAVPRGGRAAGLRHGPSGASKRRWQTAPPRLAAPAVTAMRAGSE